MPEGAVYVGRPSMWGNPFRVSPDLSASECVRLFREQCLLMEISSVVLQGKDLACWCPLDQPCHADVLLEWANQ